MKSVRLPRRAHPAATDCRAAISASKTRYIKELAEQLKTCALERGVTPESGWGGAALCVRRRYAVSPLGVSVIALLGQWRRDQTCSRKIRSNKKKKVKVRVK
jgi:hypothetical protein